MKKTWRKLKCILLSERNQSENSTYYMSPAICHSEKGEITDTAKNQWLPGVKRKEEINRNNTEAFSGQLNGSVWY